MFKWVYPLFPNARINIHTKISPKDSLLPVDIITVNVKL